MLSEQKNSRSEVNYDDAIITLRAHTCAFLCVQSGCIFGPPVLDKL